MSHIVYAVESPLNVFINQCEFNLYLFQWRRSKLFGAFRHGGHNALL